MDRRVRWAAFFGAVAVVFAFARVAAEEAKEPAWISLQNGLKARLLTAMEGASQSGERELLVNFMLSDPSVIADHDKVMGVADQLFGRVVMVPADTKGFKRAGVNLLVSETKTADATLQVYEDFHYVRGGDAVWLRQAGPEDWKTAQDPAAWVAPTSQAVELSTGTVHIDFIGEIYGRQGSKVLGIEMRSKTSVLNVQAKYAEMKELWSRVDKAKLEEAGFDFLRMENYGEARRGRFHVRQMVYLNLQRPAGADWPELPEAMPDGPLIASLGSGGDDEAVRSASTAVASVVLHQPFVEVSGARQVEGVTAGVGIEAPAPTTKSALRDYLNVR
jgi:hypothetical protein